MPAHPHDQGAAAGEEPEPEQVERPARALRRCGLGRGKRRGCELGFKFGIAFIQCGQL
jgi:hypothetical protein